MDLLDANWTIEFHSGIPAYRQIIHRIQAAVNSGELKEGDQLPSIRALCQKLTLNPATVAKAYRELEHLGVLAAEQGSGCFVAPVAKTKTSPVRAQVKKAKLEELSARFAAEALGHGISVPELVRHLNR